MSSRKKPTQDVQTEVLVASRRRCCICFGLLGDLSFKQQGQLAHVDRDPANSDADNLAFMCLEHHDWFDSRPSQSKGPTPEEARRYRQELYDELRMRDERDGPKLTGDVAPAISARASEPLPVYDDRLTLLWRVRRTPAEWVERDVERMTPLELMEIFDDPFHAAPDCHERMAELRTGAGVVGPQLLELCPGCKSLAFRRAYANMEKVYVDGWRVRAQAITELQRLHRLGRKIEGPRIVLERPQYWNFMFPPHPTPQG